MSTTAIRQKLHTYLEVANGKKIKAIYTMVEAEIEESSIEYTKELKSALDTHFADYKTGKAKTLTVEESKKRINKILKASKEK
ncbi:MAG: hypothetical protein KF781_09270 [Chitinophagaceae bacterium]|nr:hypothetical protein [Chitinophagaceae bacterium]MCW5904995.1 hypothetical protein [Chitinophagaceae bacterium]